MTRPPHLPFSFLGKQVLSLESKNLVSEVTRAVFPQTGPC